MRDDGIYEVWPEEGEEPPRRRPPAETAADRVDLMPRNEDEDDLLDYFVGEAELDGVSPRLERAYRRRLMCIREGLE